MWMRICRPIKICWYQLLYSYCDSFVCVFNNEKVPQHILRSLLLNKFTITTTGNSELDNHLKQLFVISENNCTVEPKQKF